MSEFVISASSNRVPKILLWTTNLLSIVGSIFNYVYLSYYLYRATGSQILSQFIFFSQMLLPVLLVVWIQRLSQSYSPRILLVYANALALAVCLVIYPFLDMAPTVALAASLLIGVLDAVQRVARIVAIKIIFSPGEVKGAVPLTLTAQFVAGGLAGGVLALFRDNTTPVSALAVSCILFAGAMIAAWGLPQSPVEARPAPTSSMAFIKEFISMANAQPRLKQSFLAFVTFIGVFQGFFNVSRVVLPAHVLHLNEEYVGLLQLVNSGAALVGALIFYKLNSKGTRFSPLLMTAISGGTMIVAAQGLGAQSSFIFFFFYILFFEFAFFRLQADIVATSSPAQMPLVAAMQYACVYAGMIIAILIGGVLVDAIGLGITSIAFAISYIILLFLCPILRPIREYE